MVWCKVQPQPRNWLRFMEISFVQVHFAQFRDRVSYRIYINYYVALKCISNIILWNEKSFLHSMHTRFSIGPQSHASAFSFDHATMVSTFGLQMAFCFLLQMHWSGNACNRCDLNTLMLMSHICFWWICLTNNALTRRPAIYHFIYPSTAVQTMKKRWMQLSAIHIVKIQNKNISSAAFSPLATVSTTVARYRWPVDFPRNSFANDNISWCIRRVDLEVRLKIYYDRSFMVCNRILF